MSSLKPIDLGSVGSTNDVKKYLDVCNFAEGVNSSAICLVTRVSSGITRREDGFFTFYVKDRNANLVTARLFNVTNFIQNGFIAKSFENKPIVIYYTPQIYRGSWSLIVHEISLYSGNFPYADFRGSIDFDDTLMKEVYERCGVPVNADYYTASLSSICAGKCGGYGLLTSLVLNDLRMYPQVLQETFEDFYSIVLRALDVYFKFLSKKDEFEVVNQTILFDVLLHVEHVTKGDKLHAVILDVCRALLGFGDPQHVISHLIIDSIKEKEVALTLIEKNKMLAKGIPTTVNGKVLISF